MSTYTRAAETVKVNRTTGRTTVDIRCPFCDTLTRAHAWSLAGSGKRCECGALLHGRSIGDAYATRSAS